MEEEAKIILGTVDVPTSFATEPGAAQAHVTFGCPLAGRSVPHIKKTAMVLSATHKDALTS
jgi:hypothetical protein